MYRSNQTNVLAASISFPLSPMSQCSGTTVAPNRYNIINTNSHAIYATHHEKNKWTNATIIIWRSIPTSLDVLVSSRNVSYDTLQLRLLLWRHLVLAISWFLFLNFFGKGICQHFDFPFLNPFESYHFFHLVTGCPLHSPLEAQAISAPSSNEATLAKQYSLPGSPSYQSRSSWFHFQRAEKMQTLLKLTFE